MSNPFNFFDKIFYINLNHRTDRRDSMEKQLLKYDIKAERFEAVSLTKEQNEDMVLRGCDFYDSPRPNYAPKIKGCTISHLSVILRSKLMNYNNVLILEDDVFIYENKIKTLSKCIEDLSSLKWDMFYLGCNPLEYKKKTDNLGIVHRALTTHAYAVNKTLYDYLLVNSNFFKSYPCIDGYYSSLSNNGLFNVYMSLDNIITQKEDYSDIENRNVNYNDIINNNYKNNLVK